MSVGDRTGLGKSPAWVILLVGGVAGLIALGAAIAALMHVGQRRLPSAVVLVTIDTLRADFVSFAGHRPQTTPFLDQLAERAVVFTNAYAPSSWTAPSMASLFTSLAPTSHGVVLGAIGAKGEVVHQPVLAESLTTLAETFKRAGYITIGVPANRHLARDLGFAQGFDFYYGDANFLTAPVVNRQVYAELERAFGSDWKETWKERRTFLWFHYFDPHDPYFARKPWIDRYAPDFEKDPSAFPSGLVMRELKERYPKPGPEAAARIRPLYEAEISYVDEHFRRLAMDLGLEADDVLLIITSDHGEEIAEHGGLGHRHSLYEELLRVPLLLRWPAILPAGLRTDVPVSLLDVYPTLNAILGMEVPSDLQGATVWPLSEGSVDVRPLYFELHRRKRVLRAVREGRWKLIHQARQGGRTWLFDLLDDPGELRDLVGKRTRIVQRMETSLASWLDGLPRPPQDAKSRALRDPHLKERLKALGYLD